MEKLKRAILGEKYSLSVALLDEKTVKELNSKYRGKCKPTNVLAFPHDKNFPKSWPYGSGGEILLCPAVIRKEARRRKTSYARWKRRLLVHAMLHLKGMRHGSKMEEEEKKYLNLK